MNLSMQSVLFTLVSIIGFRESPIKEKARTKCSINIWDYNYSMAYTMYYNVTRDSIIVIRLSGIHNEKDSLLMKRALRDNEKKSFNQCIFSLNLDHLKNSYKNPYVDDGDRKRIIIQCDNKPQKTIEISNVYQKKFAILFNCVNNLIPAELKINYSH